MWFFLVHQVHRTHRGFLATLTSAMIVACCALSTLAPLSPQVAAQEQGNPAEETDDRKSQEEEVETVDVFESRHRRCRFVIDATATLESISPTVANHRPTPAVHIGHSLANGLRAPLTC